MENRRAESNDKVEEPEIVTIAMIDQPKSEQVEDETKTATEPPKRHFCSKYTITGVIVAVIVAVAAAILIWYYSTRPKNITVRSAALGAQSPPTLIKYGSISGLDGSIRIDSTSLLSDSSTIKYWLTVSNTTNYAAVGDGSNNITLALTESTDFTSLASAGKTLLIPNIRSQTFPFALPDDFDPKVWNGAAFLTGDVSVNASIVGSVVWSYDTSITTGSSSGSPTTNSSSDTTTDDQTNNTSPSMSPPSQSPVSTLSSSPLVEAQLCCSFTGRISIQYRVDIVNGVPTQIPYLLFENISVVGEPAPYLYLSHSPNKSPINAARDVEILIEDTETGSFTKSGTFTQNFPSGLTVDALPSFAGGSFTVWCTAYSAWLAGGSLTFT